MPKVYLSKEQQEYSRFLRTVVGYKGMMSVSALAKEIPMDRTTLTKKLIGESPMTIPEYIRIKNILGIEKGEL